MDSTPAQGTVLQVNVKPEVPGQHGLPKIPTKEARVTTQGVAGDFNRYRHEDKRDDPNMALLLVPVEILQQLNREGWPVQPADLGENVTTSGIPNHAFRIGQRVAIGPVLVTIAKPCDPCTNLFLLPYVGREQGPKFLKTMVGRRGWYCRVLQEGTVRPGDVVRILGP
ncbi:MAG: MOSC domain-containing protein [Thermoplasmata archaeon]|nr:MOSC domain-containing protein [Thermoplasmata archaeon]